MSVAVGFSTEGVRVCGLAPAVPGAPLGGRGAGAEAPAFVVLDHRV